MTNENLKFNYRRKTVKVARFFYTLSSPRRVKTFVAGGIFIGGKNGTT